MLQYQAGIIKVDSNLPQEVRMSCPKCKAKIGITKHEIMLDTGVVKCTRCIICGYWSQPPSPYKQKLKPRPQQAMM
jgi:predicted Zn finger-like uncharacterized protein